LALESRDVERLDSITLLNLWHSLRGTKELAKRKEQEEYLTAKFKYDEANAALIVLEADLTRMDNNLNAMGDLDTKYQQAVRDKEEYLLGSGGSEARHLFEMAEQLSGDSIIPVNCVILAHRQQNRRCKLEGCFLAI